MPKSPIILKTMELKCSLAASYNSLWLQKTGKCHHCEVSSNTIITVKFLSNTVQSYVCAVINCILYKRLSFTNWSLVWDLRTFMLGKLSDLRAMNKHSLLLENSHTRSSKSNPTDAEFSYFTSQSQMKKT